MAATFEDIQKNHDFSFKDDHAIISTRYNFYRDKTHPGLFTPWNAKESYANINGETMGLTQTLKSATLGALINLRMALYETGAIFGSGSLYLYNKFITKDESAIHAQGENTLNALMSAPYYLASFVLSLAFDLLSVITRTASSLYHALPKMELSSQEQPGLQATMA